MSRVYLNTDIDYLYFGDSLSEEEDDDLSFQIGRWAQYMNRQPKGIILDFWQLLKDKVPDATEDFIELNVLVTLSSVCGNISNTNLLGPIKANIFGLVIGPSGLSKSKILIENGLDIVDNVSDWSTFPSRFSIEGAIEWFVGKKTIKEDGSEVVDLPAHPHNTLFRDEFTGMIKEKDKPYLSDIPEFLSEVYTGSAQKRYTKTAKLEKSDRVFFSFISVTTPAIYGKILPPDYFSQGLGNRFGSECVNQPGRPRSISSHL